MVTKTVVSTGVLMNKKICANCSKYTLKPSYLCQKGILYNMEIKNPFDTCDKWKKNYHLTDDEIIEDIMWWAKRNEIVVDTDEYF